MFEMESRGELVEKIEDLVNRKRYTELRDLLLPLEPADIAILADDLDDEKTLPLLFRLLPKEQAAEVFVELESDQQELLIRGFSNTELKEVLDELYLDDTVDIVEEMPANVVKRILKHSDPDMRKSINEILKYPEDSTGSIMTTEFVDLKETMTVEDALKRIRRTGPDKETINVCYVIDDWRHLIGVLSIRTLLLAEEDDSKKSSSTTSYFTDALFNEVVKDIMAKEGVDESTAQSMLYTGGYTIEATVNPKIQTAMENLMLNTDDAYFPAGWHEEEVTSISDDDVQVYNEDGTPKTRTGEDGTVYYYRNVRTQAAMVTLDYDGNVLAMVGGLGEKTKSLSLNRAYGVTRQTGSTIKPIGAYALGIEYGLVNWSTMLNNSPLYLKQDMVIRDEDYCRKNGLMGLTDKQLKAYPNAWRSWPRNYGGNYGDGSDLPLWNGLARSLNTIAIRVGDLVGASNIFNFVYNTLQLSTLDPVNDVGLAQMVMGSQTHGVTPMALAAAFQIFYDGEYTTPHLYTRVLDRDGNIYMESNDTSYQALTPQTAYVMNRLLKNVLFSSVGTASGRYPNSNGMEAFGKTGTASCVVGLR